MFARIALGLMCILFASSNLVAQETCVPKLGDVVTVNLETDVASTWLRMIGRDCEFQEGQGISLPAIITQSHEGSFGFELSSTIETQDGETRLVTMTATFQNDDPSIRIARNPAGTLEYRSPDDKHPVPSQAETTFLIVSLASKKDLKIRSWTLAEEVEPNK